jgi:hypothetical protein
MFDFNAPTKSDEDPAPEHLWDKQGRLVYLGGTDQPRGPFENTWGYLITSVFNA